MSDLIGRAAIVTGVSRRDGIGFVFPRFQSASMSASQSVDAHGSLGSDLAATAPNQWSSTYARWLNSPPSVIAEGGSGCRSPVSPRLHVFHCSREFRLGASVLISASRHGASSLGSCAA